MSSSRAALFGRVSTTDQTTENQLDELRRYAEARGWSVTEYVDEGVSGAQDKRPALDRLVGAAKRRKIDVVVVWRLDRLGRSLKHLVTLLDELQALNVGFVSLGDRIDLSTPAGKLQLHILAALAEFERGRIQERVKAGLARAKRNGQRLGRPRVELAADAVAAVRGLSVREAARRLGVSRATAHRCLSAAR